ncbi:hypothetical protein GCM10007939_11100 [Amylibacter marinus]|uniref:Uncharacterized protein n=1 Tax=Amylibacter marinus TaxID=1475483 RepID=A0ABQ5VTQ9_9RHOB|nr:hypothetical protein GCM10007939_11100 [Amylibacter marinus]
MCPLAKTYLSVSKLGDSACTANDKCRGVRDIPPSKSYKYPNSVSEAGSEIGYFKDLERLIVHFGQAVQAGTPMAVDLEAPCYT